MYVYFLEHFSNSREECYSVGGYSDLNQALFQCTSVNGRLISPTEFSDWVTGIQTVGYGSADIVTGTGCLVSYQSQIILRFPRCRFCVRLTAPLIFV